MSSPVLHMSRILVFSLWLVPAAFVASPLTADDLYAAPDPGWYNQGSGWRAESAPSAYGGGYDAESGYGYRADPDADGARYSDWRADSYRAYDSESAANAEPGWDPYRQRDTLPATEPLARGDDREARSPNGYGAPDWAQQPIPRAESQPRWAEDRRRGSEPADRYSTWNGGWDEGAGDVLGDAATRSSYWRDPPARPRYQFRDDPDLDQAAGGTRADPRFRPLTEKERARQATAAPGGRFAEPYEDRRFRPRSNRERDRDNRGTVFGYEPANGDDFYRRYYRTGP
jgi:hypothetical protein